MKRARERPLRTAREALTVIERTLLNLRVDLVDRRDAVVLAISREDQAVAEATFRTALGELRIALRGMPGAAAPLAGLRHWLCVCLQPRVRERYSGLEMTRLLALHDVHRLGFVLGRYD